MVEGMSECFEVYSSVITSLDCRDHAIIKMSTFPEDAAMHMLKDMEGAAVPPLFKCKYLTEHVNRYVINMDPLNGQVLECCFRGQRVTGSNLKKATLIR